MSTSSRTIHLLPENVRSQITSPYEILSAEHVVECLVQNALDAAARSITIEVDLARGYISVRDDGTGIEEVEFSEHGHLAKPYCAIHAPLSASSKL
jgi:DNA mismatch repair ATPase MutL